MKRKNKIWLAASAVCILLLGLLIWQLDFGSWQKLDTDKLVNVRQTTLIYGADGEVAGSLYGSENRVMVKLNDIPQHVLEAFIAAEDLRFYDHNGVDIVRIFGALWQDIKTFSLSQGASTITQQLIKLTHLTSEKTLSRKAQEAILALQLERKMSKDEILENYLNIVYFGNGAYGIEAAANVYFGKGASELTLAEGALLAGVIKSPSGYAPHLKPERSIARRNLVLETMRDNGFITEGEAKSAMEEQLALAETGEDQAESDPSWYLDAAMTEAQQLLGLSAEELLSGGYKIYTAYDAAMQAEAAKLYGDGDNFPPDAVDGTPVQSAFVAMNPKNGEISALIGGRTYDVRRGLNRATQITRQPGSAMKPISVYAAAIDAFGYVPTSFLDDTQQTFSGDYTPKNAGDTYNGAVTLRQALARSLNVATVDLADTIGMSAVRTYAQRFGLDLSDSDANLSLALGSMTYGVSPASLCAAYSALSNGGLRVEQHLIREIRTCEGALIYAREDVEYRAVSAETAYMITDVLKTAADTGSARALTSLNFPVAAKTGTVGMDDDGNRDAWTVAYTPDLVIGVWMGFDNPDSQHMLSSSTGGGGYPARLCAALLSGVSESLSKGDFAIPSGVRGALIDGLALDQQGEILLASANTPQDYAIEELFLQNSLPKYVTTLWNAPSRIADLRIESEDGEIPVLAFTSLDANAEYLLLRKTDSQTDIAATLQADVGQTMRYADMDADLSRACEYTVIPRHRLLYEKGMLLTGEESAAVSYSPGGILNRIAEFWNGSPTAPPAEIEPSGNQSIFG